MSVPLHLCLKNPGLIFVDTEATETAVKALRKHYAGAAKGRHERKMVERLVTLLYERTAELFTTRAAFDLLTQIVSSLKQESPVSQPAWGLLTCLVNWAKDDLTRSKQLFRALIGSMEHLPRPEHARDATNHPYQDFLVIFLVTLHAGRSDYGYSLPILDHPVPSLMRLYENVEKDTEARSILQSMYLLFGVYVIGMCPSLEGEVVQYERLVRWPAPKKAYPGVMFLHEQILAKRVAPEFEWHRSFLETRTDELVALVSLLWEEIETAPRYDVRLKGADGYKVDGFLGQHTAHYRYFVREGYTFPEVGLVYVRPGLVGDLYEMHSFSPDRLADAEAADNLKISAGEDKRDVAVLNFVLDTVAYHRIICRSTRSRGNGSTTRGSGSARSKQIHEVVRAHFRRLLPGWEASEEKYEEAIRRLGRLPDGYTFVTDHERQGAAPLASGAKGPEVSPPVFSMTISDVVSWLD